MGDRGKRKRIARGIYEDKYGRSGIYRDRHGRQREVRCPPGTPVAEVREAVDTAKRKERGSGAASTVRGTLAAAVDKWDGLERHLASWMERRSELRAWVELYGPKKLTAITREDVQRALSAWSQAGLKPKTLRNRLWSLRHLYHVLQGSKTETPCDDVRPPAKVRTPPAWVSPDVILAVYGRLLEQERKHYLRDAKTRARFMVLASTGRRPSEVMRAKPDDVDLERGVWRVRDGKGGWTPGGLPLNEDRREAWRVFIEANAWGKYNTGSFAKRLRQAGWPPGIRPYNLRHSVGIDMSELGVDLQDVGAALGHAAVQTTRSAYVPILSSRMKRASEVLDGRLSGWKTLDLEAGSEQEPPQSQ